MEEKKDSFFNYLQYKDEKTISIYLMMELEFERHILSQNFPDKEPDLFNPEIAENFISYIGEVYNQTILGFS